MGPCQSGEASGGEAWADEPAGFEDAQRVTVDKKSGNVVDRILDADRPEDDFFNFDEEVEEAA